MGTWILMLATDLLIPIIMIAFGLYFKKNTPKKINPFYGYRTSMSMKNMDTWDFAHKYSGKLFSIYGLAMLPVSVFPLLFVWGKDPDTIAVVGLVVCICQVILLFVPIVHTEKALKKTFDKDGNRIAK